MSIDQLNEYMPTQNIANMANNVDYNRLGIDKTNITVNFGTTPATVTILQGSIIEANGNLFSVTGSDFVFQMNLATDNYIAFDESTPEFISVAVKGVYDDSKIGVYQAGNLIRTVRWYIDQVEETYNLDDSLQSFNLGNLKTEQNSYKIDGSVDKGFLVYDYTGTGGTGTVISSTFEIFKPCTFVFDFEVQPRVQYNSGLPDIFTYIFEARIELEFNGGWNATHLVNNQAFQSTGGGGPAFIPILHYSLNPGKYRLTHYEGHDVQIYLVGVYGQTNFDAPSTIVIV